jgi:ribosomal protein S15P/S13E
MQGLLRKTSRTFSGYEQLAQAVEKIKDTAEFINEQKREEENMELLRRLEKQLVGRRDLVRSIATLCILLTFEY